MDLSAGMFAAMVSAIANTKRTAVTDMSTMCNFLSFAFIRSICFLLAPDLLRTMFNRCRSVSFLFRPPPFFCPAAAREHTIVCRSSLPRMRRAGLSHSPAKIDKYRIFRYVSGYFSLNYLFLRTNCNYMLLYYISILRVVKSLFTFFCPDRLFF